MLFLFQIGSSKYKFPSDFYNYYFVKAIFNYKAESSLLSEQSSKRFISSYLCRLIISSILGMTNLTERPARFILSSFIKSFKCARI